MSAPPIRRQSTRAVRSTTSRPQNYYARTFSNPVDATTTDAQPGFFPALTHFTDSIDTLPREIMRHFSMMKEVEAKLYGPDEELSKLAEQVARLPPPSRRDQAAQQHRPTLENRESPIHAEAASDELSENYRFPLYRQLNNHLMLMAPILDEKIAVLSTANIALAEQLERIESSYVHIPEEVSEEARLGSTSHWAYVTEKETKKTGTERTRREVAAANTYTGTATAAGPDADHAARSEARREAMMARKNRNQHQDSDFEERPAARKPKGKTSKQADVPTGADPRSFAPGVANGTSGPSKRKKAAPAAPPLERSISGALAGQKRAPGSPTPGPEGSRKRKNPPGPIPGKKRLQIADGKSPRPFSSPLLGTFNVKEPSQRGGHARGRHGSQSNAAQPPGESTKARPTPSAPSIPVVGQSAIPDLTLAGAAVPEVPVANIARPTENGLATSKSGVDSLTSLKREEVENPEVAPTAEPEVVPLTATAKRNSKTSTPVVGAFPEPTGRAGSRTARGKDANGNGSHASSESGAGERAQTREKRKRVISRKAENGDPGDNAEDEDNDEEADGDEPRYCYCDEVSYGEMVACDNTGCVKQWFHLRCAGLREAPTTAKWYCENCKASMKDSRRSRPASRRE